MRRFAAGVLLLGALAAPAGARAATPDPYSIFDRARHALQAEQYPDYLSYVVAVRVTEGGVAKSRHYHLVYDTQSGTIDVNPISDEERAAPPVPTGFIWHLQPRRHNKVLFDKKVGNPGEAVDFLGVPHVSPTYTFGLSPRAAAEDGSAGDALVAEIRRQFNDPVPAQKLQQQMTSGPMKVIAVVSSRTREYDIALSGTENVDGHLCYHLVLRPRHDPQKFRLRDLWIDAQSYQPWQLRTAGNFTGSQAAWMVRFTNIDGKTYIASETAESPIGVGDHRYQTASVEFDAVAPAQRPARANYFVTQQQLMSEPDGGR